MGIWERKATPSQCNLFRTGCEAKTTLAKAPPGKRKDTAGYKRLSDKHRMRQERDVRKKCRRADH